MSLKYETFMEGPAMAGSRPAVHVGLEWRDEMLKIENNTTPSATESAAQVRQPIYKSAVGRWRNYSARLPPLVEPLERKSLRPEC